MKQIYILFFISLIVVSNSFGQATFQKRYGGHRDEKMTGLARTYDGGYAMVGGSGSFGDTLGDVYLIKSDSSGNMLWSMIYHGAMNDYCNKVIETADHGLLLIGQTYSFGSGSEDAFLIKTDAVGNMQWSKAYGGSADDFFINAAQTFDGGYVVVGSTMSFGAGSWDMLIVRINASGDTLWTKIFGGTSPDQAGEVIQAADSNFVITGRTQSFGGVFQDAFLAKLNQSGDTLWTRIYGCDYQQEAISLKQTYDGGYIVTGSCTRAATGYDAYLNRFDGGGNLLWSKLYTGSLPDATYNVVIMSDSGYALLGFTNSFGSLFSIKGNSGSGSSNSSARIQGDDGSNVWIIRTDANGDTLWTREYGGPIQDESYGLLKTWDDGLVILGYSSSFGTDSTDAYLIKTDAAGHSGCHEKATNPVVSSPNTIVGSAALQITSGISVVDAAFVQHVVSSFEYVLCSSVGFVEEDAIKNLILYPNPAGTELRIDPARAGGELRIEKIEIYNVLGQEASPPAPLHRRGEEAVMDVSKLIAGIYFVQVVGEKGRWMGKFVKE